MAQKLKCYTRERKDKSKYVNCVRSAKKHSAKKLSMDPVVRSLAKKAVMEAMRKARLQTLRSSKK